MESVLFVSTDLRFFFSSNSSLIIYDRYYLSHSQKLLTKIHHQTLPLFKNIFKRFHEKKIVLILNIKNTVLSLPIRKIVFQYGEKVEFFTTYNNKIYNNIIELTDNNFLLKGGNGELRICSFVTGAIIFYDRTKESEKEAIEVGIGMLSLHSPEEIIKEFM